MLTYNLCYLRKRTSNARDLDEVGAVVRRDAIEDNFGVFDGALFNDARVGQTTSYGSVEDGAGDRTACNWLDCWNGVR